MEGGGFSGSPCLLVLVSAPDGTQADRSGRTGHGREGRTLGNGPRETRATPVSLGEGEKKITSGLVVIVNRRRAQRKQSLEAWQLAALCHGFPKK